ncbi:MAG: SufE family protein [Stappiaceae bacterium]
MKSSITEIVENLEYLDDWEDRYRYVIELGRELDPFPEDQRTDVNKVRGCVSQVWLATHFDTGTGGETRLTFEGDSDAHIVKGLVRIMLALFNDKTAAEILQTDVENLFENIGLREHLSPQRSNGLTSMVARMRRDAETSLVSG